MLLPVASELCGLETPGYQEEGIVGRRRLEASPIAHICRRGLQCSISARAVPIPQSPLARTYKPILVVTVPFSDLLPTSS